MFLTDWPNTFSHLLICDTPIPRGIPRPVMASVVLGVQADVMWCRSSNPRIFPCHSRYYAPSWCSQVRGRHDKKGFRKRFSDPEERKNGLFLRFQPLLFLCQTVSGCLSLSLSRFAPQEWKRGNMDNSPSSVPALCSGPEDSPLPDSKGGKLLVRLNLAIELCAFTRSRASARHVFSTASSSVHYIALVCRCLWIWVLTIPLSLEIFVNQQTAFPTIILV